MFEGISSLITSIMNTVSKIIPDKNLQMQIQQKLTEDTLNGELQWEQLASSNVQAEVKSESWLARNWRPITMLWFVGLIGSYWVGLAPSYITSNPDVVDHLFTLVQYGLSGYVVGRSVEKIATTVAPAIVAMKKPAVPK